VLAAKRYGIARSIAGTPHLSPRRVRIASSLAYLEHDVAFHRTLLEASGNDMFAALASVVGEVLAGRIRHDLMPGHPNPAATRLHADVAEAVASGDTVGAARSMQAIVDESVRGMEVALTAE